MMSASLCGLVIPFVCAWQIAFLFPRLIILELTMIDLQALLQVDLNINFQRKKGQGYMLFKRPKFSGLKGEVLEGKLRWSGDVVRLVARPSSV